MLALMLCSHGNFAAGLKQAAGMICGELEKCEVISLWDANGLEGLTAEIRAAYDKLHAEGDEVVCLCDLPHATPYNACCLALSDTDVRVVSGMSLPLLINIATQRDFVEPGKLDDFLQDCINESRDSMELSALSNLFAQSEDDSDDFDF